MRRVSLRDNTQRFVHVVAHRDQVEVRTVDVPHARGRFPQPAQQTTPIRRPHEDDRELVDLVCLDEHQSLEQLVHRPETTRQDDEGLGVLHEHRLADEEVPEVDPEIDPVVESLLEGQLDAQPHGEPIGLDRTPVHRLHEAGAAAGDHSPPVAGQALTQPAAQLIMRVLGWRAGRAEDRDRPPEFGEQPEALHKL